LIRKQKFTKAALARRLGISRAALYYISKKFPQDWALKERVEEVISRRPAYGYRRIADELDLNRKRVQRVRRLFGLKAYRRRGRKPKKTGIAAGFYPNLLKTYFPKGSNDVWVADFTYIPWKNTFLYLATVMDIFTREIVGAAVMANHSVSLVLQSLFSALARHPRPNIFHSDNGREYGAKAFVRALTEIGTFISRSAKSSPWENGYQEAFYSQFKVDLGDPNRFKTLGELVYEIHRLIWDYNHRRIHSVLKMPPILFAERYRKLSEFLS
jgi:transposase InsO family protein